MTAARRVAGIRRAIESKAMSGSIRFIPSCRCRPASRWHARDRKAGAINAALLAASVLALSDTRWRHGSRPGARRNRRGRGTSRDEGKA